MLLWSTMVNAAIFAVFLTLEATEVILFIGFFANSPGYPCEGCPAGAKIGGGCPPTSVLLGAVSPSNSSGTIKFGGYIGILTALVAWYASAAGVANGMRGAPFLPVGKPFGMGPAT